MSSQRGNKKQLPAPPPDMPKGDVEYLTAGRSDDDLFVMIKGEGDCTIENLLAGTIVWLRSKKELLATADIEGALAAARREAETLFSEISGRLGEDAARDIFADTIARPQGRPRKTGLCLTDRVLSFFSQHCSRRNAASLAHRFGLGQSTEANEKRLQRLPRK
jgi:hypothetical protein